MKKFVKLILTLMIVCPLIGIAASSCAGESDCSTAGRAMLNAHIYRLTDDNTAQRDTLDSLTITALYTDSVILNNQKDVFIVSLPLRYTNDTTTLVLHYSKQTRDTLMVRHTNNPNFVSMDCGYEMKQIGLEYKYTKNRLDSIRVLNNSTNTDGTENIKLFYR